MGQAKEKRPVVGDWNGLAWWLGAAFGAWSEEALPAVVRWRQWLLQGWGPWAAGGAVLAVVVCLWAFRRWVFGRSPGFYRCALPGCGRWLRIRRWRRKGRRRYCGVHAYYELEDGRRHAAGDRGVETFYVYLLRLDGGALYAGQTRSLRRRLAEHRRGTTRTTAGRRLELVWYDVVRSRKRALRYERKLKLWTRRRRRKVRRLVGRGPSEAARLAFEGRRPELAAGGGCASGV